VAGVADDVLLELLAPPGVDLAADRVDRGLVLLVLVGPPAPGGREREPVHADPLGAGRAGRDAGQVREALLAVEGRGRVNQPAALLAHGSCPPFGRVPLVDARTHRA